jgi:hypothetical protein
MENFSKTGYLVFRPRQFAQPLDASAQKWDSEASE